MKKYLAGLLLALLAAGALGQTALTTSGTQTVTGTKTFQTNKLCLAGSTSGTICVNAPAIAGSTTSIMPVFDQQITFTGTTAARTVTLPDASFTAARKDAAQTFTGTQTFGALVASTLNGNTWTTGTGTLTFVAGKTLTVNKSLTLDGADSTTMTFPTTSATIARTDATQTFSFTQNFATLTSSALTAGRVPYVGASSTIVDASEFQWDNSTKKLNNSFGGAVGDIGVAKSNNIDTTMVSSNYGTGGAATGGLYAGSGGGTINYAALIKHGSGYTTSGLRVANGGYLYNETAQFLIGTTSNSPVIFAVNGFAAGNEVYRINATDLTFKAVNFILDTTTGTKIGTAASQKIGLWNATPIVQPTTAGAAATFVSNTSLLANDTATFDGYTIGQVVKALRNAGLLQ